MSRGGGFRGGARGRGGGGYRGGPPGAGPSAGPSRTTNGGPPAKKFKTVEEMNEDLLAKSGLRYPPLDTSDISYLSPFSPFEERILHHTRTMYETLASGSVDPESASDKAPWRIQSERKTVGIEIEMYSSAPHDPASPIRRPILDPVALKMDPAFFPQSLWKSYFEAGDPRKAKPDKQRPGKKKVKMNLDRTLEEVGSNSESEVSAHSTDQDIEWDADEGSDEHQDYDANYFNNGDDDDDSGAGEGEDGGREAD